MYKAIIIEDNPSASNVLESFIHEYNEIDVIESVGSLSAAIEIINNQSPQIWFLDIHLGDNTIFQMLEELDSSTIEKSAIIFITAYFESEYIYKALKNSAIDYVVKPIDQLELNSAIDKAIEKLSTEDVNGRITKLEEVIHDIKNQTVNNKVPIHRINGKIEFKDTTELIYVEITDGVCHLYFQSNEVLTTKPLKYYEDYLKRNSSFIRVSNQVLLNINYIKWYDHSTKIVCLNNDKKVAASRRRSLELLDRISKGK